MKPIEIIQLHIFCTLEASGGSNSGNLAAIIGGAAGGSVLVLLLIVVSIYAYRQKRKVKAVVEQNKPFGKL